MNRTRLPIPVLRRRPSRGFVVWSPTAGSCTLHGWFADGPYINRTSDKFRISPSPGFTSPFLQERGPGGEVLAPSCEPESGLQMGDRPVAPTKSGIRELISPGRIDVPWARCGPLPSSFFLLPSRQKSLVPSPEIEYTPVRPVVVSNQPQRALTVGLGSIALVPRAIAAFFIPVDAKSAHHHR